MNQQSIKFMREFIDANWGPGLLGGLQFCQSNFVSCRDGGMTGRKLNTQWLAAVGLLETLEIEDPEFGFDVRRTLFGQLT